MLEITPNTDELEFRAGEVVQVPSTLRNRTSTTCYYRGFQYSFAIKDAAGRGFGGGAAHADAFNDAALDPGETLTETAWWDQQDCHSTQGCVQAAPGSYTVTGRWSLGDLTPEATTSFRLVP